MEKLFKELTENYKRMFCWVTAKELKEIKEKAHDKIIVEFAKNYDEFKTNSRKDDYLVVSYSKKLFTSDVGEIHVLA
jgi:hypothetical protein